MGKYFKYAIGEILLVVIGILIALQVNNWSNYKEERNNEKIYLEALRSEFQTNLNDLVNSIQLCDRLTSQLSEILTFFDAKKLDSLPDEYIAKTLGETFRYEIIFNPVTGVQKDIISSGNLKLIRNADLRQKIAAFETSLEIVKNQEHGASQARSHVGDNMNKNVSFRAIFEATGNKVPGHSNFKYIDIKELFRSVESENNLILYLGITQTTKNAFYLQLKNEINAILQAIETELNR